MGPSSPGCIQLRQNVCPRLCSPEVFYRSWCLCRFQGKARWRKQSDSGDVFLPSWNRRTLQGGRSVLSSRAGKSRIPVSHREFRYVLPIANRRWTSYRTVGLPFFLRSKYRCHGNAKEHTSQLGGRGAFWYFPMIAHTQVYLSTCCFLPSVYYEDANLFGLVDGDAQELWGLGMPYFCCDFKKSRSQINLTVWRTGSMPATQNPFSVIFVLNFTLPFQARNGMQSQWLCRCAIRC